MAYFMIPMPLDNRVAALENTVSSTSKTSLSNKGVNVTICKSAKVVSISIDGRASDSIAADEVVVNIPAGYRPAAMAEFVITDGSSGDPVSRAYVSTSGNLVFKKAVSSSSYPRGGVTYLTT